MHIDMIFIYSRFLHELLYEALSFEQNTFDFTNLSDDVKGLRESSTEQSSVLEQFETLNGFYKTISEDTSDALCDNNKGNVLLHSPPKNKHFQLFRLLKVSFICKMKTKL